MTASLYWSCLQIPRESSLIQGEGKGGDLLLLLDLASHSLGLVPALQIFALLDDGFQKMCQPRIRRLQVSGKTSFSFYPQYDQEHSSTIPPINLVRSKTKSWFTGNLHQFTPGWEGEEATERWRWKRFKFETNMTDKQTGQKVTKSKRRKRCLPVFSGDRIPGNLGWKEIRGDGGWQGGGQGDVQGDAW